MKNALPEGWRRLEVLGEGIFLVARDGTRAVCKRHRYAEVEARMLRYLAPFLRVPEVFEAQDGYVVMEYVPSEAAVDEADAAAALAGLHRQASDRFGLEFDTTIGPYFQSNRRHGSWASFYRDERVWPMALGCMEAGRIDAAMLGRIEKLCGGMGGLVVEGTPALLHGDVWSGNVIGTREGVAFIDPAIYFGEREMELAFITMFHTFSARFFDAYDEHFPIEPGFFEARAMLYRLYPVLVHVRSFGNAYLPMLEEIVARFAPAERYKKGGRA